MRTVLLAAAFVALWTSECACAAEAGEITGAQPKQGEYTLEQAEEFLRGKPVFIAPVGARKPGPGDQASRVHFRPRKLWSLHARHDGSTRCKFGTQPTQQAAPETRSSATDMYIHVQHAEPDIRSSPLRKLRKSRVRSAFHQCRRRALAGRNPAPDARGTDRNPSPVELRTARQIQ